ncbi:methylated-DNA--[protein]-cysteine S-methyltransferase [Actinotignum sanguinis]|uniref:methylated-DNA--[protein]-cysteine S-methyltransferase n=1 Tax=Actinotignum sanguinis TaxID=1445614 RepID=UPI000F7D687D|nr:methylated-DNA--[protein]-cysteine S-methyltransferase [Actinotignum sanguinis]MDY5147779.1 methylated-DNA--[protein]-cysteine S-methyltransferase [Actinotignum sanguinis]RTE50462.1 methylated-DNA--[protein]-cysteine S-methyltransferase [Actinotignum sanguinis]
MTRACAAAVWRSCDSPLGQFAVAAQAHALIAVVLPGLPRPQAVIELEKGEERCRAEQLAAEACAQLTEYFAGERTYFTLPTDLVLTRGPFAARLQRTLGEIPYGQTRSYGQLAAMAGNPRAVRAVGSACARNPIPIVLPCHRVLAARGALGGYAGGLDMKKALLRLEMPGVTGKV